jgi:hypothetical protein
MDGSNTVADTEKVSKRIGPAHNPPDQPLKSILLRNKHSPPSAITELALLENITVSSQNLLSPTTSSSNSVVDSSLVYALHTFVANLEGQVCVLKGDGLVLLDDSNSYWWLVRCVKTNEVGYIPAENIEVIFATFT